jgi:hypothetical protein
MSNFISKEVYKRSLLNIIDEAIKLDKNVLKFKDFLLDDSNYGNNYHTNPNQMSFDIKSTGETAFQRAIISSGKTVLNFKETSETVNWYDGELPIVLKKYARRVSIDIIGSSKDKMIICELKFSKSARSNSPIYATIELLTYYCFILFNAEYLDKNNVHHKNLQSFNWSDLINKKTTQLIICANKSYWDAWLNSRRIKIDQIFEWSLSLNVDLYLFKSDDFDFKLQNITGKYTPYIPKDNVWIMI